MIMITAIAVLIAYKKELEMDKFCKIVRMITLAPVLAAFSIAMIGLCCSDVFPTVWHWAYTMLYLGILPLLAYPLQSPISFM